MFGTTPTIDEHQGAVMTRGQFLAQLEEDSQSGQIGQGLETICRYVGSNGYLLLGNEGADTTIVSSNWPYDFAVKFSNEVLGVEGISGKMSDRMQIFEPFFIDLSDKIQVPIGNSENIGMLPVTCGDRSYVLSLLFSKKVSYSFERLRDAAFACSYHIVEFEEERSSDAPLNELTEREMECLSWISKGKTSDEIALIIGISRNTVNNYITSIMNKTATKSRAEAVADAVRSEII